jgi:hypothetical protein
MNSIGGRQIVKESYHDRRGFLRTMGLTVAAAQLGMFGYVSAQARKTDSTDTTASKPRTNTSYGALKHIDAGVLNIG